MNRYQVPATTCTYLYLEVLAESEEEAFAIAEETDGGQFIEEDGYGSGDWEVGTPVLKEKDIKEE